MAGQKISELSNMPSGDINNADEFVIVDSSESSNKALSWGQLIDAVNDELVSAFGLGETGQPPYVSDLNDTTLPVGVYYTNSSTLNLTGLPSDFGVLTVTRWSGDIVHQRWSRNALTPEIYERVHLSGGWGDWVEVYHTNNILGTVSQSGGVPTGAVIERGSSANGEYVRFADGTQICTHRQMSSSSSNATWTYPAAFAPGKTDALFAISDPLTGVSVCSITDNTTGSALFTVRDALNSGARVAVDVWLIAVGRWF